MDTQEGRTEYAKACAELLKKVKEPVELENYLELLSVQTGFSKDVLTAQMGVSKPEGQTPQNKPKPERERINPKRAGRSEAYRAEQMLLALLATGKLPEGMVKPDDFQDGDLKLLAQRLLQGDKPAELMNDLENDALRQAAGEAFSVLTDSEQENAADIAADCLRNVQIQHIQQQIQTMTELMRTAETAEGRAQALSEVTVLSKELAQLRQQSR